jgi:ABC-type phosphate transport system substrate-binding protein
MTFAVAAIAVLFLAAQATIAVGGPGDVAIIVNKANKLDALSSKDLKQIFAGEKTHWPDGAKVQTLAPNASEPGHKPGVQFLFGMSEPDYQKYCIHAVFVGTPQAVPRDSGPSATVVSLVGLVPGAIAFVRADVVTANVKVLKIDGMAPGDPGYPLAAK